jgi:hypothetical protein
MFRTKMQDYTRQRLPTPFCCTCGSGLNEK